MTDNISFNAESAIIAALLTLDDSYKTLMPKLEKRYFASTLGQAVFEIIDELDADGKAVNVLQIAEICEDRYGITRAQIKEAIGFLDVYNLNGGDWYISKLIEDFNRRELQSIALNVIDDKFSSIDDLRSMMQSGLEKLESSQKTNDTLLAAADVQYEPPKWLIEPYFQRGKGSMLQSDPGVGKTAFMCAVAAAVTTGKGMLGLQVDSPGNVLMLSTEDDPGVLRGRFEASGGDLNKFYMAADAASLSFGDSAIERYISQTDARMVIFDPFQSFLGSSVDMFRANETRPVLAKLFEMCARHDCACVIIAHLGKSTKDKSPVNQALGSVDIGGAMRSIIHIVRNPDNESENIAVQVKSSNARRGDSIKYRIVDRGGVEWLGFVDFGIDDLSAARKRKEKGVPYEDEPVVKILRKVVERHPGGGFVSYTEIKDTAMELFRYVPYRSSRHLTDTLQGLAKELLENDRLIIATGVKSGGDRGIRMERYSMPMSQDSVQNALPL